MSPVRLWVKTPVEVPPSATALLVGDALVPHTVPRAVMLDPAVTLPPRVAEVVLILVTVGEVTVGAANTW